MEGYYLITIWFSQLVLYTLFTFEIIKKKVSLGIILLVSVILFLIAPWLFPVTGIDNSQPHDNYTCGLVVLLPFALFWILGNGVSFILYLIFTFVTYLRKIISK
jgi:hypothetical protein